jgi:biotin transport system permease protein
MISLYLSGRSWVHRLPAAIKLTFLLSLSIGILAIESKAGLLFVLSCVLGAYLSLGPGGTRRIVGLSVLMPPILTLGVFQGFVMGWEIAIVSTVKILIMIVAADLVTATTPTQAMLSCVERALSPLCRLIRRNPRRISLAVALTMRFIPVLSDQWRTQRNAWQARSKHAPGVRLLIPFFLQAFNRTDQIAESLRARARH